jgi:hypothetical protein
MNWSLGPCGLERDRVQMGRGQGRWWKSWGEPRGALLAFPLSSMHHPQNVGAEALWEKRQCTEGPRLRRCT